MKGARFPNLSSPCSHTTKFLTIISNKTEPLMLRSSAATYKMFKLIIKTPNHVSILSFLDNIGLPNDMASYIRTPSTKGSFCNRCLPMPSKTYFNINIKQIQRHINHTIQNEFSSIYVLGANHLHLIVA